jgi:hypothetical protein
MSNLIVLAIVAGAEVLFLALHDLLVYVPMFLRLLLRPRQSMHRIVTSDIPGNVHAFDNAVISLFRTLPEPNNFNLVWTRVPLDEDVVISGILPPSRMNSLTIYNAEKADDVPNSMELFSKQCNIVLSKDRKKTDLEIDPKWRFGMIVIRNYLVPPGTMVNTPEIKCVKSGTILRPSQALPAGAPVLHLDFHNLLQKWKYFFLGNVAIWLINAYLLLSTDIVKINLIALTISDVVVVNLLLSLLGLLLAYGLYRLVFLLGKRRLSTFCHNFCEHELNKLRLCPLEKGAEGSQPSKLHTYYLMCFDIPAGNELQVTGKIDATRQSYWSLVIYDEYGLPLPTFIYDQNVNKLNEQKDLYEFDIRMRNRGVHQQQQTASLTQTVVDVSKCSKGYVLFRLVHPRDDDVQHYSLPVTLLKSIEPEQASSQANTKKNK